MEQLIRKKDYLKFCVIISYIEYEYKYEKVFLTQVVYYVWIELLRQTRYHFEDGYNFYAAQWTKQPSK